MKIEPEPMSCYGCEHWKVTNGGWECVYPGPICGNGGHLDLFTDEELRDLGNQSKEDI